MENYQKSLIDNWSLEQAGILLNGNQDISSFSDESFINNLGGLSNYINAVLLYDETNFLANGYEQDWTRFSWFEKNSRLIINSINPDSLMIDWNSEESYSDSGVRNYLISSSHLNLDLFVSPQRASKIIDYNAPRSDDSFVKTLQKIDDRILAEKESSWFDNIKIGIDMNFLFPSLAHYAFSQASTLDELLIVIMQLKVSGEVKAIRDKVNTITLDTKAASKFQKEVEEIIKKAFGEKGNSDNSWSLSIPVLFLTLSKNLNLNFFRRKEHLLFLKHIIACRSEAHGLAKDIERIFKRKILQ